jgi:predicted nuclease with TOPRIM domain
VGFEVNIDKHNLAIKQIGDIIKSVKKERKPLQQLIGGSLITHIDAKDAIKNLQKKKSELEEGVKNMNEQLRKRYDDFDMELIRVYKFALAHVPKDVKEDIYAEYNKPKEEKKDGSKD